MNKEHTTSTGHDLADPSWLDQHFNFSRETYEAMVRWVGFQPGWHVLDAGCGAGGYEPLLAEHVGPTGRLSALDLAPENIAAVETRFKTRPLACPIEAKVGSVTALSYADRQFDAIWSAECSQYLTDDELWQMLAEFKRVVKPGGLVAVKCFQWDGSYTSVVPFRVTNRFHEAFCESGSVQWLGLMRAGAMPRWMRKAGLIEIRQKFFGVEKRGPLNANDCAFWTNYFAFQSAQALALPLPPADITFWRELAEPGRVAEQLSSPDCYIRNDYTLAIGRVP